MLALFWPVTAYAQGVVEDSLPQPPNYSQPVGITSGADHNLWITNKNNSAYSIGNMVASPQIADPIGEFPVTVGYGAFYIAAGSDNNLWFTDTLVGSVTTAALGRITTSGTITEFNFPNGVGGAKEITSGSDGALWFTQGGVMGRMTTTGVYSNFTLPAGANAFGITAGPDNNLWFTDQGNNAIGRITTAGSTTEFTIPTANSIPIDITTGPDGNLWFAESNGNNIGRITPSGAVTEFPIPTAGSGASGIAANGKLLWFTEPNTHKIGRITTNGAIAEYYGPGLGNGTPAQVVSGSDGGLWFADAANNAIGRMQPSRSTHDFNTDNRSDIFFRDTSGNGMTWVMTGPTVVGIAATRNVPTNWSIVGIRDFNGDSMADIVWRNTAGDVWVWLTFNGGNVGQASVLGNVPLTWNVAGTGDFPAPTVKGTFCGPIAPGTQKSGS